MWSLWGGPGGSMAAKTCAKFGLDTVLVEREEYPNKPNSLGCLVDRRLCEYIKIDERFVDSVIRLIKVSSSDGTEIQMQEPKIGEISYVLNRKTFDREILKIALKEGTEYLNRTRAIGLIKEDGVIKEVKAKIEEREDLEIRSNIVIGADGVESKVGKWADLYKKSDISIDNMWGAS
ncbi:MAG: Digeranylgeranylglycerophospholipid reductase [Candidatus Methanolliviera sp. GoM_oil]|nr:MAG: Digeranylgeranylglycerophospholipid reductase [Candidatus Methanolliviera sp. GoM_oil]